MKILLDTHVFLWAITDDPRLSPAHRKLFVDADSDLFLSSASIWEVVIKASLGRLPIALPCVPYLNKQMERNRVSLLSVRMSHLEELEAVPCLHGDPFDRMLAAQARAENILLATSDAMLQGYGARIV